MQPLLDSRGVHPRDCSELVDCKIPYGIAVDAFPYEQGHGYRFQELIAPEHLKHQPVS